MQIPEKIKHKLDKPFYKGSVQNLYEVGGHKEYLVSETTSGGSVFDVGTIFTIEGSDTGRAGFRHLVFQELKDAGAWDALSTDIVSLIEKDTSGTAKEMFARFCKQGARTHHIGMIERETGRVYQKGFPDELSNLTLIKKYSVVKPELRNIMGGHFFDYEQYHHIDGNVIPLEYIVRLGITSGSSILKKYDAMDGSGKTDYLRELGIDNLTPWTQFTIPLVDLTTKYEPEDRNISRQEAALISGIKGEQFTRSIVMAMLGAFLLRKIFARMGLFLWDMKWEIARDGDDLVFVDTIDTDSVRATVNITLDNRMYFIHFNKQAMRDYYRIMHGDWLTSVNEAKKIAAQSGRPFTEVLSEGQKKNTYPSNPVVEREFLEIQKEKFYLIQHFVQDQTKDIRDETERLARVELEYYLKSGKRAQFEAINAVSS